MNRPNEYVGSWNLASRFQSWISTPRNRSLVEKNVKNVKYVHVYVFYCPRADKCARPTKRDIINVIIVFTCVHLDKGRETVYRVKARLLCSRFSNRLAAGVSWKSQLGKDSFAMEAHKLGLNAFPEHGIETDAFDGHPFWRPDNKVTLGALCYCEKSLDLMVVVMVAIEPQRTIVCELTRKRLQRLCCFVRCKPFLCC